MIRIHKQQAIFIGLLGVLFALTATILQKYIPLLFHHTVYYCQELLNSFSIQLPKGLGLSMFGVALILVGLVATKFIMTFVKIQRFRSKLLAKKISSKKLKILENKLSLKGLVVVIKDSTPQAFCFGIRNPKIYVSTGLLKLTNTQELEAVLRHERYHLEHKDSLTLLIGSVTASLFPFFPVLTDLVHQYRIRRELSADQAVTSSMTNASSLVSVLKKLINQEYAPSYAFTSSLAEWDTLELRIKTLLKQKTTRLNISLMRVGISLISGLVMYILLIAPVNAIELHDGEQDAMMLCMQGDECVSWCKDHATVVPPMSRIQNASVPYTPASY